MKITKCPKTVTGKHYWPRYTTSLSNFWPECMICGLVDDREVKKKTKK